MTHVFKHPKFYEAIRKEERKLTSHKLPGPRPISNANKGLIHKLSNQPTQASSPQAKGSSFKPKSTSSKIL
jgi:hypothetical protein